MYAGVMGYQAPIFGANAFLPSLAEATERQPANTPGIDYRRRQNERAAPPASRARRDIHHAFARDVDIFFFFVAMS